MTKRQRIAALEAELEQVCHDLGSSEDARDGLRGALGAANARIAELEAQLADKTAKLSEEAQRSIRLGEQVIANDEAWQQKYDATTAELRHQLVEANAEAESYETAYDLWRRSHCSVVGINRLLIAVGDRYLPATGLAARAWAAAKEGRPLRGPDGRFAKSSGVASG